MYTMDKLKKFFVNCGGKVEQADGKELFILSHNSFLMDDILSEVVAFFKSNNIEPEAVKEIEQFFTYEENSDYTLFANGDITKLKPQALREDTYYGHAFISKDKLAESAEYFHETLVDLLQKYAPEGYYFGSLEGSDSTFGFFPNLDGEDQ